MYNMTPESTVGGASHYSSHTTRSSSSGGRFGLRKVGSSIAKAVKGLRDWVKPPGKSIKAWKVIVLVAMGVGAICLGVAAWKATGLVVAGVALLGGGYLIYRCTRSNGP